MNRKKLILSGVIVAILIAIYFPGLSILQQMKERNETLKKEIEKLEKMNEELEREINRLNTDPIYVESIAREKLKKARKGEIIYKTPE
tara:strand:- start:146 stop:409 length:264 start_codon:yes stop_codon:yes gene_type:complete